MNLFSIIVISAALTACADASGPDVPNLSGRWAYSGINLTGVSNVVSGVCNIATTLTIVQSGNGFTGQSSSGTMLCNGGNAPYLIGSFDVSGTISGGTVTFDFNTSASHRSETISG